MFRSHVRAVASAAHSNGPPGQKCYNLHGHDFLVEVEIEYSDLDEWGWGPGFGEIKDIIRSFDHKNLNELLDTPPSAEHFARLVYDKIMQEVIGDRSDTPYLEVTVHEGEGNKVTYHR